MGFTATINATVYKIIRGLDTEAIVTRLTDDDGARELKLADVLTEEQVREVMVKCLQNFKCHLVDYKLRPASEGLAGFLGDHFKVVLTVNAEGYTRSIPLFVKCMPLGNKPKLLFIDEGNFFRREAAMFKLFEELDESNICKPWHTTAYLSNDSILVMPDLSERGYSTRPRLEYFDLHHILLTAKSVARFHASYANYETKRRLTDTEYSFEQEHGHLVTEYNFRDCPWIHACAKLVKNFIDTFSKKGQNVPDLEAKLRKSFVDTCNSLREYEGSLNVVIHKDLWANNIMFEYSNGVAVGALLIDFQCVRYGPPAFDVMLMLYLNTSKAFREKHEKEVLLHYYCTLVEHLDDATESRLRTLKYDCDEFLKWCEKCRSYGALVAIGIYPYTLMDDKSADQVFNCPDTFEKYTNEDRTVPLVAHASGNSVYRDRLLEVFEEFVERYI